MLEQITGVILAGGEGRRMGSVDKGLQDLNGEPLVRRVLTRLAPQVGTVLISANRNLSCYAELGFPVLPDSFPGFAGPLAGVHAALSQATTPLILTVPCDSPFLPADLVRRLHTALATGSAELAVARTADRVHRAFCLMRRRLLPTLDTFLLSGGRKVGLWHAALNVVEVGFDDESAAFDNINTLEELESHQKTSARE